MKTINIECETIVLTDDEFYDFLTDPQTFLKENFEVDIPDYTYISIRPVEEEKEEEEEEDTLCGIPYPLLFSDMFK